jgi:hypothetical protein
MATRIPDWNGGLPGDVNPGTIYLGSPSGISAYADQQTDAANNYLLTLGTLSASLTPPVISPVFPTGPSAPPQITAVRPELQAIVWTSPDAPAIFTEVLDVSDVMPEPFDDAPPTLNFGSAPAPFSELAPDSPGISLVFEDPELNVELPLAPELLSLNVLSFDGLNLPTIDPDAVPVLDVVAPSIREYAPGADYTSNLLTGVRGFLQNIIDTGATGLNPNVEQAIWDRGREREAISRGGALRDLDKMEEQGFALPPGTYVDARLRITTESEAQERGFSREVMIKQAELAYAAGKDYLAQAVVLESKSMDIANDVEQRLFESTKYATEAGIQIYNARVQAYSAYLDAYKTKIQIYVAQVQAETARVEAFKAQVQAELAKAQINQSLVEQYKAQIEAALSAVEIYKARIQGISIKAEIEKTKIEAYGEQVRAYAAKINAYTAGVEGYRASLEAESTKQKVYQSQVEAFSARVTAAAKQADIRIAAYRGRLDANLGRWDGYKAAIAGEASKAQAVSAFNQSLSAEYQSEVAAVTSFNETLTKQWQAVLDEAYRVTDIGVNAAKANAELYMTTRSLALDAAKAGAQVSAQLGAAALNAINWSQSINTSVSNGISTNFGISFSQSDSYSDSTSDSTSHNYNYSASV